MKKSPIEWIPLDLPVSGPAKPLKSPVIGWEKIDFPEDRQEIELPVSTKEWIGRFPESFQKDAKKVYQYITLLEMNPESACEDPETRKLIRQLAASGCIAGVYIRESSPGLWSDAPRAKDCLPLWLQEAFVKKHGLDKSTHPLNAQQQMEVCDRFGALVDGLPYKDGVHGRYFELSRCGQTTPLPRQYKYYIEGTELLRALQSGALDRASQALKQLGIGLECKLFESDRMVIYGKGDISQANKLLDALMAQDISGRGPAQDVWTLKMNAEGSFEQNVSYSNDQALGDGGKLPDRLEYALKKYSPQAFIEWYLKLCAFIGKSPMEPYRTALVYAIGGNGGHETPSVRAEAEALAGYPVVFMKRSPG